MAKRTKESDNTQDHEKAQGRMKRVAAGIWKDTKTGETMAGGAYDADTGAVQKMEKAIREGTEELEEAQDRLED